MRPCQIRLPHCQCLGSRVHNDVIGVGGGEGRGGGRVALYLGMGRNLGTRLEEEPIVLWFY